MLESTGVDPSVLAAVLCLGTALGCLMLALARIGDRTGQLTHAAMGVAMAGMFSPWGDPLPAWTGIVGFTVLGAWFAAAVLRRDRAATTAQHLAISCAAMVVMYLMHGHHEAAAGSGHHAGHAGMGGGPNLAVLPLALVLAGYFVWHTWTCVDRARVTPGSPGGTTRTRPAVRVEPVAHGVMSALMAAMFLGVV